MRITKQHSCYDHIFVIVNGSVTVEAQYLTVNIMLINNKGSGKIQ